MSESVDIVIAGAGVIGLCSALQIARRTRAKVLVLERAPSLGAGSTGASSAVCRAKYSLPETVALARDGIDAYRHWSAFTGLSQPVARLNAPGVVWFDLGRAAEDEVTRLSFLGVRAEVVDDHELAARFPALNPCVAPFEPETAEDHICQGGGVHMIEVDNGYVEPMDALQDLYDAVRRLGVEVRFGSEVTGIECDAGRVSRVVVNGQAVIACGHLVNAAGPWCNNLLEPLGLAAVWPLVATRIQIIQLARPSQVVGEIPVCADAGAGIYFRPQNRGQQIVLGSVREQDELEDVIDPDVFNRSFDDDFAREKIAALQHRLRGLDVIRAVRGYSGLYTINRADVHPVVGKTPVDGFYVANGFSGHGFKLAPAIGSLVAQAVTGEKVIGDTAVDPRFLAFDREPIQVATRNVLA